jgi:hypothetical protein
MRPAGFYRLLLCEGMYRFIEALGRAVEGADAADLAIS